MSTALKLGPGDHGRPMTLDEFTNGDYDEGYQYELIDGRLYVSPAARFSHEWFQSYVERRLWRYSDRRPDIINYVTDGARVFVPDAEDVTAPEPDLAVYRDFPLDHAPDIDWRDVSPLIVVEIMGGDDSEKDLVRNVDLYWQVPSIQEYWLFDLRDDPSRPTLRVYRRDGDEWTVFEYGPDDVYITELLPEFELPVTPGAP